jgi:hypothetical protein
MKKLSILFILAIMSAMASGNDFSKLFGTWKYKVDYAPQGYEQGQMIFSEKEGKVTGQLQIQGYSIPAKNIEFANGQYKFVVEIEYENIPVTLKVAGDSISGQARTPDGNMPFKGVRVKPEQK